MGEGPGPLKTVEGQRPTMLPMKGQPCQHRDSRQDPEHRSIHDAMQAAKQRRTTGHTSSRHRALDQLQRGCGRTRLRCGNHRMQANEPVNHSRWPSARLPLEAFTAKED